MMIYFFLFYSFLFIGPFSICAISSMLQGLFPKIVLGFWSILYAGSLETGN